MSIKLTGRATEQNIKNVTEITYEGTRYSPILHKQVIDTIDEYLYKNNISTRSKEFLTASNGQRVIGKYNIAYPDSEMGYMISFKNSHDGSMSFGICSGANVWICSNGNVYGDVSAYKSKHVGANNIEMLNQIQFACERIDETMQLQIKRREQLKQIEVNKKEISQIAGELFLNDEIITATQLGILKKEIENPTHNYGFEGSAWQLLQNLTFSTKETTPISWHKTHSKLGNYFVDRFGLLVQKEELV
jgi:hypothetical protein